MGNYINLGNFGFQSARNSRYVDKSELISVVNHTLFSEQRFSCVSRSRRFGKSVAAKMLCAYYDQSCDSRSLFEDLKIADDPDFERHLNKYPVICLDISDFITRFKDESIVLEMDQALKNDIHLTHPDIPLFEKDDLMELLARINAKTNQQFIFIIDEWDSICREFSANPKVMDRYVDWLRRLFKGGLTLRVFAGVYMTGILPIKKYDTQSALNNFVEYSMVEPMDLARYFGFTKKEVQDIALKYGMDFDELEKWYDGYQIGDEKSMFNPNSVMMALKSKRCRSYWSNSTTFTPVSEYISMNYDGLKDDIITMLAGGRCQVNPTGFQNDLKVIQSKDDVLTVLIHLGYLSYDWQKNECYIPNKEVEQEMVNAVEKNNWKEITTSLEQSHQLLLNTIDGKEALVAEGVARTHDENTSILSYNDENSLSCVISLAYYYARNDYIIHREFASGKGFADLVLIPRKQVSSPAIIIELKYGKSAEEAIKQIKRRDYMSKVREHTTDILLVGINYDRETKEHQCIIERNAD